MINNAAKVRFFFEYARGAGSYLLLGASCCHCPPVPGVQQRPYSQRKKRNAARNFSLLCKIALTQLKNNPRKGSPAMKRKMAGWDVEFLKELPDAEWQTTK